MLLSLILACGSTVGTNGNAEAAHVRGAGDTPAVQQDGTAEAASIKAVATLEPRSGSRTSGTVTFTQAMQAGMDGMDAGMEPGTAPEGAPPDTTPGTTAPGATSPGVKTPGAATPGTPGATGRPGTPGNEGAMGARMNAPVEVTVRLANATPGNHALFLHENGDCSAPDASSAGGWFTAQPGTAPAPGTPGATTTPGASNRPGSIAPTGSEPPTGPGANYGEPGTPGPEGTRTPGTAGTTGANGGPPAGYLGFVTVAADGRGEKQMTLANYTLEDGAQSINNRSIVVYEKAPDFTKGGDPGARQSCGVIRREGPGTLGTR